MTDEEKEIADLKHSILKMIHLKSNELYIFLPGKNGKPSKENYSHNEKIANNQVRFLFNVLSLCVAETIYEFSCIAKKSSTKIIAEFTDGIFHIVDKMNEYSKNELD